MKSPNHLKSQEIVQGQSCLLARRLIEAGSRFVTVSSPSWDTHVNNFSKLRHLLPPLDQAFPALILDLPCMIKEEIKQL